MSDSWDLTDCSPPSSSVLGKNTGGGCSVAQSCLTLCDPLDCSMPTFSDPHYFPEFAQILVHWVDDAVQPSNPPSLPSPPALNFPQHQGPSQWDGWPKSWSCSFSISPSNEYSMLISLRIDWIYFLVYQGLSRVFSSAIVQKHQFFGAQPSLWSNNSHMHPRLLEKP